MAKKKRKSGSKPFRSTWRQYFEDPILAPQAPSVLPSPWADQAIPPKSLSRKALAGGSFPSKYLIATEDESFLVGLDHVEIEGCSEEEDFDEHEAYFSGSDKELGARSKFFASGFSVPQAADTRQIFSHSNFALPVAVEVGERTPSRKPPAAIARKMAEWPFHTSLTNVTTVPASCVHDLRVLDSPRRGHFESGQKSRGNAPQAAGAQAHCQRDSAPRGAGAQASCQRNSAPQAAAGVQASWQRDSAPQDAAGVQTSCQRDSAPQATDYAQVPLHRGSLLPSPTAGLTETGTGMAAAGAHSTPLPSDLANTGNFEPSAPSAGKWRDLFASNRTADLCPKLRHFSAITNTKSCILSNEDSICDLWKSCLVGYVAGKSPGYRALNDVIENTWKCEGTLSIHDSGWLVYKFSCEADRLKVLNEGSYLVYGRPLLLKPMSEFFDFSTEEMFTVPIWVKFPNLPLKCWSTTYLSKIASVLGKPIQCDRLTASKDRISYARGLIELNIMGDLPSKVSILLPNGSTLAQAVVYETLPIHCKHCRVLGHSTSACKNLSPTADLNNEGSKAGSDVGKEQRTSVLKRLGPSADSYHNQLDEHHFDPMHLEAAVASNGWETTELTFRLGP